MHIVRRMLYYRGGQTEGEIRERYFFSEKETKEVLDGLCSLKDAVLDEGIYYHGRLYERARANSIRSLRMQTSTCPPENYAAYAADKN